MPSYGERVLKLFERNPDAFMVANRDGHDHVIGVYFHRDFVLGVDELELRMAIVTMPRHQRKVWLATEVGCIEDAIVAGGSVTRFYRFGEPLSVEETMDYYGYARGTVETYLSQARRHLELSLSRPRGSARGGAGALLRKLQRCG
jgi:hypothetical protein